MRFTQHLGELEQGKGITAGCRDETLTCLRRQCDIRPTADQRRRRLRVEPAEREFWQPACLEAVTLALTDGEQHGDSLRLEPTADEHEGVGRSRVEPVGVIDETEKRPVLGRLGQQAQHGERDQEAVVAFSHLEPERSPQRAPWGSGRLSRCPKDRTDDLVQRGEGDVRLRFDPAAAQDLHVGRSLSCVLEEGGLADTRLAADDEHPASRLASVLEERAEPSALGVPAVEHPLRWYPPSPGAKPAKSPVRMPRTGSNLDSDPCTRRKGHRDDHTRDHR